MSTKKISITIKGRAVPKDANLVIGGRYAFQQELGKGGVGEVLLAYDLQLERWVAVKRINVQMGESACRAQLAIDEAKRLARLQHPNIVTVFDVLDHKGDVLMVMEYLRGYTLDALNGPLTIEDFLEVARQSLGALGAAHTLGIIHLDIKSSNIMIVWLATGQLQVKLLDFGLATLMEQPTLQKLGESGSVLGSVYTMAPEQFERKPVGVHTDLYSLGCVFYHALGWEEPFQGESMEDVMNAHLDHVFRPLAEIRPDLPPALCGWVEKMMAKNPADRPPNAATAFSGLLAALSSANHSGKNPKNLRAAGRAEASGTPLSEDPPVGQIHLPDREQVLASVGKRMAVHGLVHRVWENVSGTIRFLNFEGVPHNDFSVLLLLEADCPEFSREQMEALIGREIRVTGKISEFHGSPQMIVESPSQISSGAEVVKV